MVKCIKVYYDFWLFMEKLAKEVVMRHNNTTPVKKVEVSKVKEHLLFWIVLLVAQTLSVASAAVITIENAYPISGLTPLNGSVFTKQQGKNGLTVSALFEFGRIGFDAGTIFVPGGDPNNPTPIPVSQELEDGAFSANVRLMVDGRFDSMATPIPRIDGLRISGKGASIAVDPITLASSGPISFSPGKYRVVATYAIRLTEKGTLVDQRSDREFSEFVVTPIPPAIWLFLTALAGLGFCSSRSKNHT